jgi:hypothetical protein
MSQYTDEKVHQGRTSGEVPTGRGDGMATHGDAAYAPPTLTDIGSVNELTAGAPIGGQDFVSAGSGTF